MCPALPIDKRHVCNSENDKIMEDTRTESDLRNECAANTGLPNLKCLVLYAKQRLKAREMVMGVIKDSNGMIYDDFRDAVSVVRGHYADLRRMRHEARGFMAARGLGVQEPWYEVKLQFADALRNAKKAAAAVAEAEHNVAKAAVAKFQSSTSKEWQLQAAAALVSRGREGRVQRRGGCDSRTVFLRDVPTCLTFSLTFLSVLWNTDGVVQARQRQCYGRCRAGRARMDGG